MKNVRGKKVKQSRRDPGGMVKKSYKIVWLEGSIDHLGAVYFIQYHTLNK